MNLTPTQKTTTTLGVLLALLIAGWKGQKAWGEKADQSEVNALRERVGEISTLRREDAKVQENILSLLKAMDRRMERIEDGQNATFQAIMKSGSFQNQPNQLPPNSGPSPLNR